MLFNTGNVGKSDREKDVIGYADEKEGSLPTLANGTAVRDEVDDSVPTLDRVPTLADMPYNSDEEDIEAAAASTRPSAVIGPVVAVQPTNQELAAAAAEDLEGIAVASSTDSSLDETDIDMLVDIDHDKVRTTLYR
jgi:hypothetical protein